MNILFIGSSGALSLIPFKKLLASEHTISAVAVYRPVLFDKKIIALENESLALAANQSGIPVIDFSQPVEAIRQQCRKYEINIMLMSCYSKRLSEDIFCLAEYGCYNMHPSLLPQFRGPEPVFWQYKLAAETGVSWHRVTAVLDAGDIVARKEIIMDDGLDYFQVNHKLATQGADLILPVLAGIESEHLHTVCQNSAMASYYPYPQADDFVIDTAYTAQQLYNFMCATRAFNQVFRYQSAGYLFYLDTALDYDNNLTLDAVEIQANRLYIPCNVGVLIATYTDKIPA